MKKLLFSALMLAGVLTMSAIPAQKVWKTFRQSDGTQVKLMLVGDENFHCFKTTDGYAVMEENGNYYYANVRGDRMIRTDVLVHDVEQRSAAEISAIQNLGGEADIHRLAKAAPNMQHLRKIGTPTGDFHGSKKGIIILVSFADLDFKSEDPRATFDALANQENYRDNGAYGSVHDYFLDQSNGVFDLTFDVVGPYKAPKNQSYYGENKNGHDQQSRVIELLKFGLEEADKEVNYSDYDWDGDGEVDQVFMLYAGMGEANGGASYTIWPHESHINAYPYSYKLDGVKIDTYACGNELDSRNRIAGIGTICHEFTHCLGLPDFYDTGTNSDNYGMGMFDVMCSGSYNGDSWLPAAYTGYERNFCGWLDYVELNDPCKVSALKPIANNGECYIYYNPANSNEYYLFEHRNSDIGWDRGLYGKGLLIYHVNYIASRWKNNTVNAGSNPLFYVQPADNKKSIENPSGDLWPYTSIAPRVTYNEFSATTEPCTEIYNAYNGKNVLDIKLSNIKYTSKTKLVSFVFNDGTEEHPITSVENIVDANTSDMVTVYSVDGVMMNRTSEKTLGNMPKGMYIVKSDNGETKKLLVK